MMHYLQLLPGIVKLMPEVLLSVVTINGLTDTQFSIRTALPILVTIISPGKNGQYTEMESSVLPILVPVSTISQQFVVVMISWKT